MYIKQLKEFLNNLPEEYNKYQLVNREYDDFFVGKQLYSSDTPINGYIINEETHELEFMSGKSFRNFVNKIIDNNSHD